MEQYFDDNSPASDSEGELEILEGKRTVTEMQTAWGAQIFKDWLMEHALPRDFEELSDVELDKLLERFYSSVKKKTGELYTMSAMSCIKSAIQRHVRAPPWGRTLNFANNPCFISSNKTFQSVCKKLEGKGLDTTKRNCPILPEEFQELCKKKVISTANPYALQNLVWIHLMLHFGTRNANDWRQLKFTDFIQRTDVKGRLYITEIRTQDLQTENKGKSKPPKRMYERPKDPWCPVYSFNMYKSVVNQELDEFWQKPDSRFRKTGKWYLKQRLSVRSFSKMLKRMCTDAGLNSVHSHHCLRATAKKLLVDNALSKGVPRRTETFRDVQHYPVYEELLWKESYVLSSLVATVPITSNMNETQIVEKPYVHGYIKEEEITFENEDPLLCEESSDENISSFPSFDSPVVTQKGGSTGTEVKKISPQASDPASHLKEEVFVCGGVTEQLCHSQEKVVLQSSSDYTSRNRSQSTETSGFSGKRKYRKKVNLNEDPLAIPSTSSSSKRKKPRRDTYNEIQEEETIHNNDNMMTLQVTDTSGRTQEAIFFCSDETTHGLDQQDLLSQTPKECKQSMRKNTPRRKNESAKRGRGRGRGRGKKDDMYHVFGMFVAKTLRDINDDNTFWQVRIMFNDILLDAMAGKYKTINQDVTKSMNQNMNFSMNQKANPNMNPQAPYIFVITQNNTQAPMTSLGRKILPNNSQAPIVCMPFTQSPIVPETPVQGAKVQEIQNMNTSGQHVDASSEEKNSLNSNPGQRSFSAAGQERLLQDSVTPPLLDP